MEFFQEDFKYSTIASFRSAISAYHDAIEGISDLLTSIFNKNPSQPNYNFIWHVKNVIDFYLFKGLKHDNLKDLALKLTMLLALTSAGGQSDIDYLDTRYLIKQPSGYIFQFRKTTKASTRATVRV